MTEHFLVLAGHKFFFFRAMPKFAKKAKTPNSYIDYEVELEEGGTDDELLSSDSLYCGSLIDDDTQSARSHSPLPNPYLTPTGSNDLSMDFMPSPVFRSLSLTPTEVSSSLIRSLSPMGSLDSLPPDIEELLSTTTDHRPISPSVIPPVLLEPAAGFRCTVRRMLVTYPKSGKLHELEKALLLKFGTPGTAEARLAAYAISREKHQDGSFHLHMAVMFTKDVTIRGTCLNRLIGSNCNIVKGKNGKFDWINMVKYVCGAVAKKVGQYHEVLQYPHNLLDSLIAREEVLVNRKEKVGAAQKAFDALVAGDPVFEVVKKYPTLAMQVSSIQRLQGMIQQHIYEEKMKPKFVLVSCNPNIDHPISLMVSTWINENLMRSTPREMRSPALYICGPPAIGKSTFFMTLASCFKVYIMTPEKMYVDEWQDNMYDLVIFDEFVGQWPVSFMNSFIDGSMMRLQRKGIASIMKLHNVPVIVMSNAPLNQHYPHQFPVIREAFQSRFVNCDFFTQITPLPFVGNYVNLEMIPK